MPHLVLILRTFLQSYISIPEKSYKTTAHENREYICAYNLLKEDGVLG